jgi:hypothetical protein
MKQALMLLSPKWQQQSQQQLLLASVDSHTDDSSTVATVKLKLDYTALATVLKLPQMTDKLYATAVQFLVKHTGFESYHALTDVYSERSLLHDTQGIIL